MAAPKIVRVQFEVDDSELVRSEQIIQQISKDFNVSAKRVEAVNADLKTQTGIVDRIGKEEKELERLRRETQDPKQVKEYNQQLEYQRQQIDRIGKSAQSGNGFGGLTKSMTGSVIAGNLLTGVLQQAGRFIIDMAKDGINLAATMEQNRIAFETFTGSAESAEAVLKELEQFATKTPFEFPEIAESAKRLLAFGVRTNELTDTLRRLGDIAAGTGKPLGEISLIYGQVLAKGRLQGEELLQFAEKGVPLLQTLAKNLGISTAEANKLVSAGKIGFEDVKKAIQSMTDEGGKFFDLTEKQSQSLGGRLSTLNDSWNQMKRTIGEQLAPVVSAFTEVAIAGFDRWSAAVKKSDDQLKNLPTTLQFIAKPFANNINFIGGLFDSLDKKVWENLTVGASLVQQNIGRAFSNIQPVVKATQEEITRVVQALDFYELRTKTVGELEPILWGKILDIRKENSAKLRAEIEAKKEQLAITKEAGEEEIKQAQTLKGSLKELEQTLSDLRKQQSEGVVAGTEAFKQLEVQIDETQKKIEDLKKSAEDFAWWARFDKRMAELLPEGIQEIETEKPNFIRAGTELGEATGDAAGNAFKDGLGEGIKEGGLDIEKAINDILNSYTDLFSAIVAYQGQVTQNEIAELEKQKDANKANARLSADQRLQIEKQLDGKIRALKEKQALREQALATFQAIINGAIAVTQILAAYAANPPVAALLIGLAAATTAAQIATINAAKFAKGGFTGNGIGQRDETGQPVAGIVHAREFVFDRNLTAQWRPIFEEIHQRRLSPADMFGAGMVPIAVGADNSQVVKELRKIRRFAEANDRRAKSMEYSNMNSEFTYKRRLING